MAANNFRVQLWMGECTDLNLQTENTILTRKFQASVSWRRFTCESKIP